MPKAAKAPTKASRTNPLKPALANITKSNPAPKSRKAADYFGVLPVASMATASKPSETSGPVESYLFLVRLENTDDPAITRLFYAPSNFTFRQFHFVLQVVFGWAQSHGHSFDVYNLVEESPGEFGRGRHLLSLNTLGDMIGGGETSVSECDYTLADIWDKEPYKGNVQVNYEYDHGDSWEHDITFLGKADPGLRKAMGIPLDDPVACLGGEGHPCAEDCGSYPGWEELKDTFKKRSDPEGMKTWYKTECLNGDPKGLDPYRWSVLDVNDVLQEMNWEQFL